MHIENERKFQKFKKCYVRKAFTGEYCVILKDNYLLLYVEIFFNDMQITVHKEMFCTVKVNRKTRNGERGERDFFVLFEVIVLPLT